MSTSTQYAELERIRAMGKDLTRRIVLSGARVLPMDGRDEFIGDVVIVGDTIEALGPGLAARIGDNAVVLDVAGSIVLPGLVDSHIHAWESQLRGIAPDATFAEYMSLTHGKIGQAYRPEDIAVAGRLTAAHAINAGTTTIVDNSHNCRTAEHSDAAIEALRGLGIRAVYAAGSAQQGEHDDQLPADVLRLRDTYSSTDRLMTVRMMDSWPTLSSWTFAAEHSLDVSTEMGGWVDDAEKLLTSGLLRPGHTLNHCSGLSDTSWAAITDSGAAVNVVPRSDSHFGLGAFIPIMEVNRRGIQEGISSDNEVSYGHDLLTEMRVLQTIQRGLSCGEQQAGAANSPTPYGAMDALRAATVGGALNASLSDCIGTLTPGKKADLLVIALDHVTSRLASSSAGAIVNFAQTINIDAVFINGSVLKWGGRLVTMDYDEIANDAEASRAFLLTHS